MTKRKKTVFIVLGSLAAVAAAIVAFVFYATSGMTGAADDFFDRARAGSYDEVYALTSAELQNTTDAEQLASFIKANRFDQVAETSWSSRSIESNVGKLEGSLTLDDGGVIPVELQLVNEDDGWKVSFIKLQEAGLSGGAGPQTGGTGAVPPEDVVFNNVRFHTLVFLDSVRRNDLEHFKRFWVDSITLAELDQVVAPMREAGAVEALVGAQPTIERATPFGGGGFEVAGYVSAEPWRYEYTYVFLPDGDDWKIGGFKYDLFERD